MIDTNAKLAAFLPVIKSTTWLALDTEADSLHAYPEKVCLIQISTAAGDKLIDPLAKITLDPLLEALNAHELIMHGADYDLRLLRKHHEFIPSAIFDTMLASRLLGERQFGLGSLVEKFLGVKLDKGPQKADWARRPLTERMEKYARNDTHYLKPLADLDSVWRVRGSHALNCRALAILRELWHWREKEAVAANRPPFFILSHDKLVDIAAAAAAQQPIEPILPPRMPPRRRENLIHAIKTALSLPDDRHPGVLQRKVHRPTETEMRQYCELERHRNHHAHELGIDPTLIASRTTLGELARDWDKYAPELMNWQKELLK